MYESSPNKNNKIRSINTLRLFSTKKIYTAFLFLLLTSSIHSQSRKLKANDGLYVGINNGTWFQKGRKTLGNPYIIGLTANLKSGRNTLGIAFDRIGETKTKSSFPYRSPDKTLQIDRYNGKQISAEFYRQLYLKSGFSFDGLIGIGYGYLSFYNRNSDESKKVTSIILSPGMSAKYTLKNNFFFQLTAQYNRANYTPEMPRLPFFFRDNYITKLIIGKKFQV